jgi:hypothetical protein
VRRNPIRIAAAAAAIAATALCASSAQAATTCDPLGDVFCTTTGNSIQLTFTTFTPGALQQNGQITAIAGGVLSPGDPYLPPNPSTAIAQGKLYPGDPYHPYAIGRVYAPTADRSTYLFDGHLVPASDSTAPADSYGFRGMLLPPNPI